MDLATMAAANGRFTVSRLCGEDRIALVCGSLRLIRYLWGTVPMHRLCEGGGGENRQCHRAQ